MKFQFFLFSFLFLISCSNYESPNKYVDVFIGTGGHGHTYPGATLPFGMIQPSPVNGTPGWDWVSGYHYSDSIITGFAQTHLSGTGIGDLNDILIMPTNRKVLLSDSSKYESKRSYASRFSHDREKGSQGYYSVFLDDYEINAEMTATERVAMYRFTYEYGDLQFLNLDLGYSLNWDSFTEGYFKIVGEGDDKKLVGYRRSSGWANDQHVYFAMEFSSDFMITDSADYKGFTSFGVLKFENSRREVLAKIAISSQSEEGALANLQTLKDWDFDETKLFAEMAWDEELGKIKVQGDEEKKTIFYTALYHSKLAPVLFSDANQDQTKYTIYSLWDTFRAQHPLLTITNPERVNDMIRTMLNFYEENGLLPVWELHGNETNTMTGYHAIPVIADAYAKGFRDYDAELAFEAMKASAMQDKRGTDLYRKYQYIPSELEHESVTKTLEYAFDDWAIAQMAFMLGKESDYEHFIVRSGFWQNVYDEQTKFMRGKTKEGNWVTPFDPKRSNHRINTDYTEGNAWQHSWFVPHQVDKLIELMGGDDVFSERLDSLFNEDSNITGENTSPDISGLIGQYAHGNEPSHHIGYLYNYAGKPWKSQEILHEIMNTQYSTAVDGLSGNEDCGQMSAWYVFSAIGFYPVNPASGNYVLGTPQFEQVEITLSDTKTFTIIADGVSDENIYIKSVSLNGEPLERSYISHKEIIAGGELIFEMGSAPNKNWAKKTEYRPIN
ncbi:MAG: GH92 family glycosyl hydrolase [Balneola sp.]|jgi:predicted alpha-1,2-mannosidase